MSRMFRAFPLTPPPHASTGDNRLFLNLEWQMSDQTVLMSPTVFNFFKPGFAQPGPIATAGLVSPEFQIYNDTTAMWGVNRNFGMINWGVNVNEPSGTNDYSPLDPNYAEPLRILTTTGTTHAEGQAALVEYFNQRMMGGNMSDFLRQKILAAYAALPSYFTYTTSYEVERIQMGLYLVMFSPEFNVQR